MEQEKRIFDGAWVAVAPVIDGMVSPKDAIKVDLSNMTDKDDFDRYVWQNLREVNQQIIASYGVPEVLLNKGGIDCEFFAANRKLKASLREPYEMWLQRQDEVFEYEALASPDAFETEYFGRFESMEEYAVEGIEFIDSHYQLPMKLSGKMSPERLLQDAAFMSLLWVMKGKSVQGWKNVYYVFHTQEYLDIIDPL